MRAPALPRLSWDRRHPGGPAVPLHGARLDPLLAAARYAELWAPTSEGNETPTLGSGLPRRHPHRWERSRFQPKNSADSARRSGCSGKRTPALR